MTIKTKFVIRCFNKLVFLALLDLMQPVKAGLLDPPAISYSVTDCRRSYLVQLFEDGRIEYRGGVGAKIQGWQTGHTSPEVVQAILKQINSDPVFATDDREKLPAWNNRDLGMSAIRISKANRYLTFYCGGKLGECVFDESYCIKDRQLVYLGADKICKFKFPPYREENIRSNLKSKFSQLELEIMKATNVNQWVTNPGRSYCLREYSMRINDLKKPE